MKTELKRFVQIAKNYYHLLQALLANIWFGFPSARLKVIGITGTDGKTTTTHLVYHLLKAAGKRTSMISTVYAKVGQKEYDTGLHTTTPDPFLVQKMLKRSLANNDEYFVLETTSHALDQNRVWGIRYEIGILTNVTHEHLDYHRDYREYLSTKALMLKRSKHAIINTDDLSFSGMVEILKNEDVFTEKITTYGLKKKADFMKDFRGDITDLASFNAYNYLAAYVAARLLGIGDKQALDALKTYKLPPGRIDMVYEGAFKVIVDFAHTPNAIKRILETIRENNLPFGGRIIHVFGSAGLRDVSKRPLMGASSGQEADLVILTEEDYRTEDPGAICRQIAQGLENNGFALKQDLEADDKGKYCVIVNRDEAIRKALKLAREGDVVVITGKGHEKSLCRGRREYVWSDKEAVVRILKS